MLAITQVCRSVIVQTVAQVTTSKQLIQPHTNDDTREGAWLMAEDGVRRSVAGKHRQREKPHTQPPAALVFRRMMCLTTASSLFPCIRPDMGGGQSVYSVHRKPFVCQWRSVGCLVDFRDVPVAQNRPNPCWPYVGAPQIHSTQVPMPTCKHGGQFMTTHALVLTWLIGTPV